MVIPDTLLGAAAGALVTAGIFVGTTRTRASDTKVRGERNEAHIAKLQTDMNNLGAKLRETPRDGEDRYQAISLCLMLLARGGDKEAQIGDWLIRGRR